MWNFEKKCLILTLTADYSGARQKPTSRRSGRFKTNLHGLDRCRKEQRSRILRDI